MQLRSVGPLNIGCFFASENFQSIIYIYIFFFQCLVANAEMLLMHRQVMATICEELPLDNIMLVYLSASG